MDDRISSTGVLLSSSTEVLQSIEDIDDFCKELADKFERIMTTAQSKFDELQNDLKNLQLRTITQKEATIATYKEIAKLRDQFQECREENIRDAAENIIHQKRIDQLLHNIKRYIIFKIDHQKETVVIESIKSNEDIGSDDYDFEDYSKQAYEAFINDLKNSTNGFNTCCYGLFDFHLKCLSANGKASNMKKTVFIYYSSDKAERRDKMIYALTVTSTTSKLHPAITIQATEESELSHEVISKKLIKEFHIN